MLSSLSSKRQTRRFISVTLSICLYVLMVPAVSSTPGLTHAAGHSGNTQQQPAVPNIPMIPPGFAYRQTNFVSDIPGLAPIQDPLLVNPWGISMSATSPFWFANNKSAIATMYGGDVSGSPLSRNSLNVTIPGALPTGIAFNGSSTDFVITQGGGTGPARFIFASKNGNIVAWRASTPAIIASSQSAVYTGLALANNGSANFLYAADFAHGKIDVFNGSFVIQSSASFPFTAVTTLHGLGFNPYNIQNIGGTLWVTFAKYDPITGKPIAGPGNGYVLKFDANGIQGANAPGTESHLNAPWGVAIAPSSFGAFSNDLLIGNFGEGGPSINAYDPATGAFLGSLQNEAGVGIEINELWALQFGNGVGAGDVNTLYFSAGTGKEEHGLFGSLKPTTASATSLIQFASDTFAIGEGSGHIDITITRAGDASNAATVNFNTFDQSRPDHASQRSDYEIALGKLTFNPGETSKTVRILIVNDNFDENDETVDLALSNPTGAGVGLGSPNVSELTITDNDTGAPVTNPIDDSTFFVRQHYLDFLNREPDAPGLAFWVNQIESCGADAACREVRRINVSAAFFLSIEFQKTGLAAYLTHRAAFGPLALGVPSPVLYGNFERDTQALQKDFVFGQTGSDAVLEANKVAFYNDFVTRPEFVVKYPATLTNAQFVDNLLISAGLSPTNFIVNLANSQENPPTNPTLSGGARRPASFGTAIFNMNAAQDQMTFSATINNLDFTGSQTADVNDNMVAAHIHAGASVTPTTNGPVVWGFFGAPQNDNNPNDVVKTDGPGVGGTIAGKWDPAEGNSTTFAAQLDNLKNGRAYINFHTTQFGGGEIRGQFPAMQAFRDTLASGLDATTETRATVLRKVSEFQFLNDRELNGAFVFMQYAGYLRRDPDTSGYNFWLTKLREFNGNFINAEMVKAFITSSEYRQRFGPA